ncbi:MAG: lysostaphin resistance A-like protein [Bacteroidota bacterium]
MVIDQSTEIENKNPFPFNNLFLIKGYVSGKNNFWFYLIGFSAAMLGYFIFQAILMFPLISMANHNGVSTETILNDPNILFDPSATGMNSSFLLALMMGMFVFTLLFFVLAIKYIQKKTLRSIITGFDQIRWPRFFFSFLIWGCLIILFTLVNYFLSPNDFELRFDLIKFILLLLVSVLLIPIQTATEEILFRGYLLQGFALIFKNGLFSLLLTSVLFGLMHGTNPEVKTHGYLIMMPYYILFGAFLGALTLLDEGLELSMGIHCANNLISALIICSKTSVLQTDAIFYTTSENPTFEFISWLIMATICFFILSKKYKLNHWKLIIR